MKKTKEVIENEPSQEEFAATWATDRSYENSVDNNNPCFVEHHYINSKQGVIMEVIIFIIKGSLLMFAFFMIPWGAIFFLSHRDDKKKKDIK